MGDILVGIGTLVAGEGGSGEISRRGRELLIWKGILLGYIGRGRGEWRSVVLVLEALSRNNSRLDVVSVAK